MSAELYLQTPLQLEHAVDLLLDSELWAFHSERMCENLTDCQVKYRPTRSARHFQCSTPVRAAKNRFLSCAKAMGHVGAVINGSYTCGD